MRALSICMGLALSLAFLAEKSIANITVTKTNSTVRSFDGTTGTINLPAFELSDFLGNPAPRIIGIEVSISFTKFSGTGDSGIYPYYNEIQMVFGKPELETVLIASSANANAPANNSFATGPFRNAGTPSVGFNGVVTFRSPGYERAEAQGTILPAATARVNSDQFAIPNSNITNTAYLPAGPPPPLPNEPPLTWNDFVGQSALGVFSLRVTDLNVGVVDPLVVSSVSVSITAVPEPSSFGLCGLLTLGGAFIRRRVRG